MNNFTRETYVAKREIVTFARKLSVGFTRPKMKFITDMIYGMIASESVILSDIAGALKEDSHKINTVDRLSRNLRSDLPGTFFRNYIKVVRNEIPDDPIVMIDDSDVVKPYGEKFEGLGLVRDGSDPGNAIEKGYHIAEAIVLSKANQPISLFSRVYSEKEETFVSANIYTFRSIDRVVAALKGKAVTFVFDRGYDSNAIFEHLYKREQLFIIRLTQKRNLFCKNKWLSAPTLCKSRKGKFKTILRFQNEDKECYIGVINTQITGSKRPLRLVIVYGLSDTPMMLATNRAIHSKDDAVKIARTYLSRWRIEEYFRFKKQHFGFENFRVRNLNAMNNLNTLLSCAIAFTGILSGKDDSHGLKNFTAKAAAAIRKDVLFFYYRIAKGLSAILAHAKSGVRDWYKPKRRNPQLCFKLTC